LKVTPKATPTIIFELNFLMVLDQFPWILQKNNWIELMDLAVVNQRVERSGALLLGLMTSQVPSKAFVCLLAPSR
jgi:hypothetical protein